MTTILFFVLYLSTFEGGFLYRNKQILLFLVTVCVCVISVLSLIFMANDNKFIHKLTILVLSFIAVAFSVLYLLKISGIYDKIDSVEDLRNYVASFGYMAVVIYIIMNFLQVVVLPIPGIVAVGTGVALFGPLKTSIFSLIGILSGSIIAFFIGRYFGYKVVSWLIGKEELDKWLKRIENKDKLILTFMFLFPFFPDDVLCFVSGLSSMTTGYFIIMITVCRIISVFASAYSLNGSVIPFNTWWGITIWLLIVAFTIALTIFIYKKGDNIEKSFKNKLRRKNR
jgi:uncharacterized membrane protein YdjX (TVP38/TMEM64 family)